MYAKKIQQTAYAIMDALEAQKSKPTIANIKEILRLWKEQGEAIKIGDAPAIAKLVKQMLPSYLATPQK